MDAESDQRFVGVNLQRAHSLHIRHAELLQRWPVIDEDWARRVEQARLDRRDTTPGAATFGR